MVLRQSPSSLYSQRIAWLNVSEQHVFRIDQALAVTRARRTAMHVRPSVGERNLTCARRLCERPMHAIVSNTHRNGVTVLVTIAVSTTGARALVHQWSTVWQERGGRLAQ